MIDTDTTLRLMLGLVGVVYLLIAYMEVRATVIPQATVPTVIAASLVVAVWVFAPSALDAGVYSLPLGIRQAGLAAGGGAVVSRYLVIRRRARGQPSGALDVVSTPLLGVSLVLASANWLVAVAAGVVVGTDVFRRAAGSARRGSSPAPPPQDDE